MKRILCTLMAACLAFSAAVQFPMEKFPNYKDFSIPKPDRSTKISPDDLKLTDRYLPLYPQGIPVASREQLYAMYDFYRNDPVGRDYDENGPRQGAPDSALVLNWQAQGGSMSVRAVLFPRKSGARAPKIRFAGNQVIVDGKKYAVPE